MMSGLDGWPRAVSVCIGLLMPYLAIMIGMITFARCDRKYRTMIFLCSVGLAIAASARVWEGWANWGTPTKPWSYISILGMSMMVAGMWIGLRFCWELVGRKKVAP